MHPQTQISENPDCQKQMPRVPYQGNLAGALLGKGVRARHSDILQVYGHPKYKSRHLGVIIYI